MVFGETNSLRRSIEDIAVACKFLESFLQNILEVVPRFFCRISFVKYLGGCPMDFEDGQQAAKCSGRYRCCLQIRVGFLLQNILKVVP